LENANGATQNSLVMSNIQDANTGDFQVIVTNALGVTRVAWRTLVSTAATKRD